MLNFFRKIRQKHISETNLTKYILYAFFEILLVVVGILIAVQVNNWNEKNKRKVQELKYLERFRTDLIRDTTYYNSEIRNSRKAIDRNSRAIKMAYLEQENLSELYDLLAIYDYRESRLTVNDDTYIELKSSGQFNIIQNVKIKIAIIELYRLYRNASDHIDFYNDYTQLLLADLNASNVILKYYPYPAQKKIFDKEEMFNKGDWEFINNPSSYKFRLLENCMLTFIIRQEEIINYFIVLKEKSSIILNMIDDELNTR